MANSDKKQVFKCPFCDHKYFDKKVLYVHMENKHPDLLNGLPASQVYFNFKYKKTTGRCIQCGKPTKWNIATEKYERLCSDKCRKDYREEFRRRMKNKGKDPDTFLNDAEQQNKMLANRRISGIYTWSDSKSKTNYVGSYEREFLEYLDIFLRMNPSDVMGPAPQIFNYQYEGKEHFHIPDFYITSLDLIVQIKSKTNMHYRQRDIKKELVCDKAIQKSNHNYIKIYDKDYEEFFDFILHFENKTK